MAGRMEGWKDGIPITNGLADEPNEKEKSMTMTDRQAAHPLIGLNECFDCKQVPSDDDLETSLFR